MTSLLLACGGLMTIAGGWYYYRHQTCIDTVTRLADSMKWNHIALILALLTLVIWIVLAILRIPARPLKKKEKKAPEEAKKNEKAPVYLADFLHKPLPGYAVAFYAASFLLLSMAAVFYLLLAVSVFTPVHLLLAVTAFLTLIALLRAALIYVQRRTKLKDAFLLPMPMIFLTIFGLYDYTSIMREPEIMSYALEILAVAAALFSYYGFFSHYFGRTVSRFSLFSALSASSLSAIVYFSYALLFFMEKVELQTYDGSLYSFLAKLMLFAAVSIFSVSYAIMIWNTGKKKG